MRFNVRIYGLLVDEGRLLVTDEFRKGMAMTKLPGGGLQFGEGVEDALKREWMEELGAAIRLGELLYINPFLQISAFDAEDQVLCIYYRVHLMEPLTIAIADKEMDFREETESSQSFRWIAVSELQESNFTFPIDCALVPLIRARFLSEPDSQNG